jgi:hypothetical protein
MSLVERLLTLTLLSSTVLVALSASGSAVNAQQRNLNAPDFDSIHAALPDAPAPPAHGSAVVRQASDAGGTALGEPLTFHERLKIYAHSYVEPENYVGPALGASIGQWEDSPSEWGEGAEGFGKRYASGLARNMIARTISFGVAAGDGEDSRYVRSADSGIWRRTRHAVAWTFLSRSSSGGTTIAYSQFAGFYGAGFIANAWEPPSQRDTPHALERGSTALLSSAGGHLFSEFWPDVRHKLHLGRATQ